MPGELDDISTLWSEVYRAHHGPVDVARRAQERLLKRYEKAIRKYLLGAVKDREAADELFQEFATRFVRGDFQRAAPDKGRFRAYLKRVLRNLVNDHWRVLQARRERPLDREPIDLRTAEPQEDDLFHKAWRETLTERAMDRLRAEEIRQNSPGFTILRMAENKDVTSTMLADYIKKQYQREVSEGWIRKRLYLTRKRLVCHFVNEVAGTLTEPTLDDLEQELAVLGVLGKNCRAELQRRRDQGVLFN